MADKRGQYDWRAEENLDGLEELEEEPDPSSVCPCYYSADLQKNRFQPSKKIQTSRPIALVR